MAPIIASKSAATQSKYIAHSAPVIRAGRDLRHKRKCRPMGKRRLEQACNSSATSLLLEVRSEGYRGGGGCEADAVSHILAAVSATVGVLLQQPVTSADTMIPDALLSFGVRRL